MQQILVNRMAELTLGNVLRISVCPSNFIDLIFKEYFPCSDVFTDTNPCDVILQFFVKDHNFVIVVAFNENKII